MFGAEEALFARCCNRETFEKAAAMVNGFKEYFLSNGMAVDENPSPGKPGRRHHDAGGEGAGLHAKKRDGPGLRCAGIR